MWVGIAAILCGLPLGCSRAFWRDQANRDSYRVVESRMTDPRWVLPRISVTPDPRSRFFDPYDPDNPPLPPDDPAAHFYMHRVNGFNGYKNWCKLGIASSIENPQWLEPFGLTPEMTVCRENQYLAVPLPKIDDLTLVDAVELSNINSRELQFQLEQNYLAALAVTFERFQFAVRYLGFSGEPGADLEFESIPGVENGLDLDTNFGISQLLPTGAQWIIELTNNTLWLFDGNGPDRTSSISLLSYSIVQPLCRGAGRKVVLENLTQTERNSLYAVRDLARFRKTFFTDVTASYLDLLRQVQTVKNQRSNVFRTQEQVEIQRALASRRPPVIGERLNALPPGLIIPDTFQDAPAGFPEVLRGKLRYDPQEQRLLFRGELSADQERQLRDFSDDADYQTAVGALIQRLQSDTTTLEVLQLESQLTSSVNDLRSAETQLRDQQDNFKILMGLPPDMEITLDESFLDQYELIDPQLTGVEQRIKDFVDRLEDIDFDEPDPDELRRVAAELPQLATDVRENALKPIEADFERVNENMPNRLERLETEEDRERVQRDVERDRRLFEGLDRDFLDVQQRIERLETSLQPEQLTVQAARAAASEIAELREALLKISQSAQVVQIGLRVELITLQEFTMGQEESVNYGLENRLDLKNALASVTDARRQLEVVANTLQKVVDLRAEGDVFTSLDENPFDFRGDRSSFRAGISFVAPLDQIDERNSYRTAVINYQRARRAYMEFEDQVKNQIRRSWRQLTLLRENFEIDRQAIRISALLFDSAVEDAANPVQQGNTSLNLLQALAAVLNAQNRLIGNSISYEQQRLNIFRDMGIMEIDARGLWVDKVYQDLAKEQDRNTKSGRDADEVIFVTDAAEGVFDEFDGAATRHVVGHDDGSRNVEGEWLFPIEGPLPGDSAEEAAAHVGGVAPAGSSGPVLGVGGAGAFDADELP